MDKNTYNKVANFLDEFTKEHLICELIALLKYDSVVDILKQVEEYEQQLANETEEV